ncbi:hypothetical protein [Haliea sp. E17]|uniref:hypothetical protein n=1 Tax=Haliea sp. E17 TaxID=3401576 RepID=UPI003AACA8B8
MHKFPIAAAASLASAGAFAHSGDHAGNALQALSHIWTHADHWLTLVGVAVVTIAGLVYQRARQGMHSTGEERGE